MPDISVIMGIYNGSRTYAAMAIDSVLNQTYTGFEYIICDDGSENTFYEWLEAYCKKDNRIRLLRNHRNRGLAYTLNRCLKQASGFWIARMDADDISLPDRLEKQVEFLRSHKNYALVGSNAYMIDAHCIWGQRRLEERPRKESFLNTSPFIHPAVMIRREVFIKLHGYKESQRLLRMEDYDLFLRLYAAGWRGYNLQEPLLMYREDLQAYKKRKYRYRLWECRMRYDGYRRLEILKGNLRYVLKPLAAGLIPVAVMQKIRRKKFASDQEVMNRNPTSLTEIQR